MNRYMRVIAIDVVLAVVAVILYSPGLLGLSPFDPDVIRAALSVSAGVALVGIAGASNAKVLQGARTTPLRIGSGTDDGDTATFDEVYATLTDYQDTKTVATYAFQGMELMDEVTRKSARLKVLINMKFESGSLSWTRFMGVVDSVTSTIVRNSAILANRIQAFDHEGYERDRSLIQTKDYLYDNIPDDIQLERYELHEGSLKAMQDIVNANERLILEFDRLSMELSNLDSNHLTSDSEEMLEEIRRIIDQTKFYAD